MSANTIDEYFKEIDALAKESFPNLSKSPPNTLYHYTSSDTSQKILQNNSIRLTHAKYMSDSAEINLGLILFYQLTMKIRDGFYNQNQRALGDFIQNLACKVVCFIGDDNVRRDVLSECDRLGITGNPEPKDIYVSCFSEAQDNLPMWYMYADHGKGICLGFDAKKLTELHQIQFKPLQEQFYTQVIYDAVKFKRGMAEFLSKLVNFMIEHFPITDSEKKQEIDISLPMYYITVAILAFKHPKFEHEKEWRLFGLNSRDDTAHVKLDETKRPFALMKYNKLSKDLLKEVWIAPANPIEEKGVKIFFSKITGKFVEVTKSEIPFRSV